MFVEGVVLIYARYTPVTPPVMTVLSCPAQLVSSIGAWGFVQPSTHKSL